MSSETFTIPAVLLQQLYTYGSLANTSEGVTFSIKNRLTDTSLFRLLRIRINGEDVPHAGISLDMEDGRIFSAGDITQDDPLIFPMKKVIKVHLKRDPLPEGEHQIEIAFVAESFGELAFVVSDTLTVLPVETIPRDREADYSEEAIAQRQKFVEDFSGKPLHHIKTYSVNPDNLSGNVENFTGVAQIPLGFAGPIRVMGEHANGDFLIPLATTEGTLVASYNRGIKVLNLSGGVRSTVLDDAMQRAPVFVFEHARDARDFVQWVHKQVEDIKREAEKTSSVAKMQYIDPYLASKFVYLRFNFSTGDAAGQNMVGRATFAACQWMLQHYEKGKIKHFYLESNFATDKKASQVNILHTRGKRVTSEAVVKRDVLLKHMRVEPESLDYHQRISTIGAFLSGANNNGAHSPNAITAMFIALGQDVANVSESSAGVLYSEITPKGDLYISITIPSLIVATYGGGTGLATQRELLEIMGCYGKGKVNKLAEIVGGVVLAGELSLGSAISSSDWVSSHELYGRNR